jgi:hypothetical protein
MDKKYITLFKELAQATAASAETVMDYDRDKGDQKGLDTATIMRDDYQALAESLNNLDEEYQINKADAAKLLVGAMIMANQLQDRINNLKKAITGYQTDVIPKLQKIVDEAKNDEEVTKMANELFIIEDK